MIRFEFRNYDCDESAKNYPEIEMTLDGDGYNVAYLVNMFRQFLLTMSFTESTINDYVVDPTVNGIEDHIEYRMKEKFNEFLEKSTKVSEECTDNNTLSKNEKPVEDWNIEDWREEFKCWMETQGKWEVYKNTNKVAPFKEIEDPYSFILDAFTWSTITGLNWNYWDNLDDNWREYIASIEGEKD